MLSISERMFHDKLRKLVDEMRTKHMPGAPTEIVAAQMAYLAISQVFASAAPALEVGDQRSQRLDSRDIANTLSFLAATLLEPMTPENQTISMQAITRGIVRAFGEQPGHPLHPLFQKFFGADANGAATDPNTN